jgi:glycosyltransferase involved in cell wall biosynthesis
MMPPRGARILITTDAVGGVWVYSVALGRALARQGCEVVLVTTGPPPRQDQVLEVRDQQNIELAITDFALEWMDPEGKDFSKACAGLEAIARRARPDLIHINGYREAMGQWQVPVLVAAHSCVRSWWLACRGEEPTEMRWHSYAAKVKAGLAAADGWVAPTAAFRDRIESLYAPPRPGTVIHNGLEVEYGTVDKERFILAAGRLWDEAKNVKTVAAAAGASPWPLKLAGAGAACASQPQLEVLGDVARVDVLRLMARAAVFVAPALYEPFGLSILEAATARCALILSDIASLRELWAGSAIYIDPRDARALAVALRQVCEDDALRAKLQSAAARRAARYQLSAMVDAYGKVYRELLSPPLNEKVHAHSLSAGGVA